MKNRWIFILAPAWFLLFWSCREVGPKIDLGIGTVLDTTLLDTTFILSDLPTRQQKIAVIEEFTGVSCPNCPDGTEVLESITAQNPGRVAIIGVHNSDFFAFPLPNSQQDFRNPAADALAALLGPVPQKPMAGIDRKKVNNVILQPRGSWSNLVQQALNETPPVNILINAEKETDKNSLLVRVELTFFEAVSGVVRLSVFLSENNIIDAQDKHGTYLDNYIHNHVLRTSITSANGQTLNEELLAGRVFIKEFRVPLEDLWVTENLEIVALVHAFGSDNTVYQSAIFKMQ